MSFQPLNIGSRAYKYIRMGAIKNVIDAMIELITNAHDAYNKDNTLHSPYCICVQPIYENKKILKEINVIDQAIGLTGDNMENNFLTVGNYTSSETSRGFFSRGAKDVSNIGNVIFESIKDNKYSKIEINSEGMGRILNKDINVTDNLRTSTGIKINGLKVNIKLLPPFKKITTEQLKKQLSGHYALRDIISDNNFHVTIDYLGKCIENETSHDIIYNEPDDKQILVEADYILKKYDNASAQLKIYSTNKYNPDKAILVKSDSTVYCKTIFDRKISSHPYIKRVYGEINLNNIKYIFKNYKKNDNIVVFNHIKNKHKINKLPDDNKLVIGSSTIATGIHLGAYMGAKNIILIGHDCGTLDGEPNFNGYHTDSTYKIAHKNGKTDYIKWLKKIEEQTITLKKLLKKKYGCNIYSLNPFINFGLEGHVYSK